MRRKRWKSVTSKLLVIALFLQISPLLQPGQGTALADEPGGSTVTVQTYGNTPVPVQQLQTLSAPQVMALTPAAPVDSKLIDYAWEKADISLPPAPRQSAVMTYDEAAGNVMLFGGQLESDEFDNETWIWDGNFKTWSELTLSGQPSARMAAAAAFDPQSGNVVLFGGEGNSGVLGDTWLWDGENQTWTELVGLTGPSARGGAQIAYDGQQLVLFGGYTGTGENKTPLGDTWLWDGTAKTWTEVQNPTTSPPAAFSGVMAFDGQTAVMFGGNLGKKTETFTSVSASQTITYDQSSSLLWIWDRSAQSWSSNAGPSNIGRWGLSMAYDGRRVIAYSGLTDFINLFPSYPYIQFNDNMKIPSNGTVDYMLGPKIAFAWTGSKWEDPWHRTEGPYEGMVDPSKFPDHAPWPFEWPIPRSYANMAFDGKGVVLFGGNRTEFKVRQSFENTTVVETLPEGLTNETWTFKHTVPSKPELELVGAPALDTDTEHYNGKVSVITNVYNMGGRSLTGRGVEYRLKAKPGEPDESWTPVPFTGTNNPFTSELTGLTWQKEYEVRGYAANEIGRSETLPVSFILENDPKVEEPFVKYTRVGPSFISSKDKKRIVAVGDGIINLLRKPVSGIDYYLKGADGTKYKLDYNVINDKQLELTLNETKNGKLADGKYDLYLEHDFFDDYTFLQSLTVTSLDFYKPRNYSKITVPKTDGVDVNQVSQLVLQGLFTESPDTPNVYVLNDTSEVVTINESLMFKGSRLTVDKRNVAATISGEGRLYVNGGGEPGSSLAYTLYDGAFDVTSDNFTIALNNSEAVDYLNMNMPVTAKSLIFTPSGMRMTGDVQVGLRLGSQIVNEAVTVDALAFSNNRFDLTGKFDMKNDYKVGPFETLPESTKLAIDSRTPYVGVTTNATLPGAGLSFELNLATKRGTLDGINFGIFQKAPLGSTGLQVDYMYGSAKNLAGQSEVPQRFSVGGSVSDILTPKIRYPGDTATYPLLSTNNPNMELSSYGLSSSGEQFMYWLKVPDMNMTVITDPKAAGIKGFGFQGFTSQGAEVNVFDAIKGSINSYSFNKLGYLGKMKAIVNVPKGIPLVGGRTIHNVDFTIDEKKMRGFFTSQYVGITVTYTFSNNTMLFEINTAPPAPSALAAFVEYAGEIADNSNLFLKGSKPHGEVRMATAPTTTFTLSQTGKTLQPSAKLVDVGVEARMADGQLTSVNRHPALQAQVNAANSQVSYSFDVTQPYEALITLSGNQTDAVLSSPGGSYNSNDVQRYYNEDTTFIRVPLNKAGTWKLTIKESSRISIHELMFAHASLSKEELAALWMATPGRQVTALTLEERGAYLLEIGASAGEAIVYKQDGRPYVLNMTQGEAAWNAYRDSASGKLYVMVDAAEQGTWLVDGGSAPEAAVYRVSPQSGITEVKDWAQAGMFPTIVPVSKIANGQAIIDIYGANEQTELYTPQGNRYAVQLQESEPDWNAIYDDSQKKLTVLLNGSALTGDWTVKSSRFTEAVVYNGNRKFNTLKPLQSEGNHKFTVELSEAGNYVLALSGADANTTITAPNGQDYPLVFDEQSPVRNASLQSAADRQAVTSVGSDPQLTAHVGTSRPAADGRDMLYVTLRNAAKGKWTLQTDKRMTWEIQEITPVPEFIQVSAASAAGMENKLQLSWSVANAEADTEVTVMLTGGADQPIGEVIAQGLNFAGTKSIDIPVNIMPGTYYVSIAAQSAGWAPIYAIADQTVTVTGPVTLAAPELPEVASTGNAEVTLRFPTISGAVGMYRVWQAEDAAGSGARPIMDYAPKQGDSQLVVISGLPVDHTYYFAVSAIGSASAYERIPISLVSNFVTAELPAPQPAGLTASFDAGASAAVERSFTYFGDEEKLIVTEAQQVALQVTPDQDADLSLTINGQKVDSRQVSQGSSAVYDLHQLLGISGLEEREYSLIVEAVNARGDRSSIYRKLFIDRTAPLLIATNGNDQLGNPLTLNGTVVFDGRVYISGQTEAGSLLKVNDKKVPVGDDGKFSYYAPLAFGAQEDRQTVVMAVYDEVGNYTAGGFEVIRGIDDPMPDHPTDLATLALSGAKMSTNMTFNPGLTNYMAAAFSDKVKVYAVPASVTAAVQVDGEEIGDSGFVEVDIPSTGKTVQVTVKADNQPDKTYTVQIGGVVSVIAALSDLKLHSAAAAQPDEEVKAMPFTGASLDYNVYVANEIDRVTMTPTALKPGSFITVRNQPVNDGTASQGVNLQVGPNFIPVIVTSPDGLNTQTYNVNVTREGSGNAYLQSLGVSGNGMELRPDFVPTVFNYELTVPHSTQALSLLAAAEQPDAVISVTVDGDEVQNVSDIQLAKSVQVIAVKVTAQDKTVQTYRITVLKQLNTSVASPILTELSISGISFDPVYSPHKHNYTVSDTTQSSVQVVAQSNDPQAIITVNGKAKNARGELMADLQLGANMLIVNVESADLSLSQTYALDIKRLPEEGAPTEQGTVRTLSVQGSSGAWKDVTEIVRTRSQQGLQIDTVTLDAAKARSIVEKASQTGERSVQILVTDLPDAPADEQIVSLDAAFVKALAEGGMTVQLQLPDAHITLSAETLAKLNEAGDKAYFRIVPVKNSSERGEVEARAVDANLVKAAADGAKITTVGRPVKIETNYSGYQTRLLLPLKDLNLPEDEAAAKQMLAELAVYIEHSDGDLVLKQGTVRYDEQGDLVGIEIEIDKFSTFTIVRLEAAQASQGIEPYLSGYPDGTFRPEQAITRAELATIMHRVLSKQSGGSSSVMAASGYPDVLASHWAAAAIVYMQQAGIMVGDPNGSFRPDDAVSRGEMAAIADNMLSTGGAGTTTASGYNDVNDHWALQAIARASAAGILQGYPDGTFLPDRKLNRAEAVKVLNSLLDRPVPTGLMSSRWPDVPAGHWALQEIESASGRVNRLPDGSVYMVPGQ